MEFHISRQARDRYQFDQSLFALSGNVIFANFHAVRLFAKKINDKNDLLNYPERAIKAGQINALGLIDEILHYVLHLYREQKNPLMMEQAFFWLKEHLEEDEIERALLEFTREFPPVDVYRRQLSASEYLEGSTEGVPNRQIQLEEMITLWITNRNPAVTPFQELFDDSRLINETAYRAIILQLHDFFEYQPPFGPDQQNILDMLQTPALKVPHSLFGQLEYIREKWAELLGKYLYRLLSSLDLIREEEKSAFFGPGPVPIPIYDHLLSLKGGQEEFENFSADKEWMPRLVLIAKNSYVWLDQLSRKYQREIRRLDQIPNEELDILARWGITGLWLIGLWERSKASAQVKQLCGNPEAIASAYSLSKYEIAYDLGGESAYQNLRDRAWQHGIRLASDMVPNHMGIDSDWVLYNPDRFISLPYSPYPGYSFNGPNLSPDGNIGIYLEDHYFNRTDAAVVFKRVDFNSGDTRYIYHGNDGTSMPWNDTAQLDYLNPEVREAVIQTILNVARQFPIIRFDAAMTLAKKHYQRLWYPEPGSGGDIPSRADHGLTKAQFDEIMPIEFWREVVDRAAIEAPDTLLLAEAFWLMEGYFVRTLGMHRVYNSAFMNLLRDEDNDKYRTVMKNTLEFDPEILKRFVNFMNNPDERTAVDQFGNGDKYFGICTLMATMPGLPMFGHGQVEGFSEKYGMEFRRAYWDEQVNSYLVERHQREIFPLLHKRALFAGVDLFLLYDFFTPEGSVNEDVFAYSNGLGNERALVIYNNRYSTTQGWIRNSVGFSVRNGSERQMVQKTLGQGLNLHPASNTFTIFRDQVSGMEYIQPSTDLCERGLYVELNAYKAHVFVDFREVVDDQWQSYQHLCSYLAGRGVHSVEEALRELILQPVQGPFREIANTGYFNYLMENCCTKKEPALLSHLLEEAIVKYSALLNGVQSLTGNDQSYKDVLTDLHNQLDTLLIFSNLDARYAFPGSNHYKQCLHFLASGLAKAPNRWLTLFSWLFTHNLGKLSGAVDYETQSQSWMDEWQLGKILANTFGEMGQSEGQAWRMARTVRMLIAEQNWYQGSETLPLKDLLEKWLAVEDIQQFLGVNRYKDVLWFNKESFEEFTWWMMSITVLQISAQKGINATVFVEQVLGAFDIIQASRAAEEKSDFQISKLLSAAKVVQLKA